MGDEGGSLHLRRKLRTLPAPAASGSLRYGAFDFVLRTLNPNLKLSPNPEPLTWVLVGYDFTFLV